MQNARLWQRLFGLVDTVVERVWLDEDEGVVVVGVRPAKRAAGRCPKCGVRSPFYDRGEQRGGGRRRWRAMDLGVLPAFLEAPAPRVRCGVHGVVVAAAVPWARHNSRFTRDFEDQAAWLATHTSKTAVAALLRTTWRSMLAIVARIVAEGRAAHDPFAGLVRVGIDEISYKKGQNYLMVVVDHDTGRLVWVAAGNNRKTLEGFFDRLGQERCEAIRFVTADAAHWINYLAAERCPNAVICMDPFHVVAWASDALDEVRRQVWNTARQAGASTIARQVSRSRYALWKNPAKLTDNQRASLAFVAAINGPLYRAYLLKEQLRVAMVTKGPEGIEMMKAWLGWAFRCRIPAFVELARRIRKHWPAIENSLTSGLSNGLVESINTKLRLLMRIGFGHKNTDSLIALALLDRGGYCPPLPGRQAA